MKRQIVIDLKEWDEIYDQWIVLYNKLYEKGLFKDEYLMAVIEHMDELISNLED